ncbi:hypothetical protein D1816_02210 [Aquimarina sp. AD10]|uniref:Uncharacterized protein n=1 Tax=Aquimarina aggregata TaxID=1642818 RepID=A0A163B591_9FLAO|nr:MULTISPECIES: hypothetical protein [Aquimarina]AXT59208.1 hypothetical protein D1816_02210 [Aquimarina sp. AD10]KZS41063.1 hypothetical protein AWE51_23180 [Aquimarina aggregata]RKM92698.1 hypothetical protein D7033_20785 [Aquimarina sp. AD10]
MKLLILISSIFIYCGGIKAQNTDLYKKYKYEDFLKVKTIDSGYNYVKTIHRKINTDYDYRKNQDDVIVRVLLINNGDDKGIEIIPIDETNNFRKDIIRTLIIANENLTKNDSEKYITEFNITYDYEPHMENWQWKKELPKIRLPLYKTKVKTVTINCEVDKKTGERFSKQEVKEK